MHLKTSSAKRRPFCLGLNVLTHQCVNLQCKTYIYNPSVMITLHTNKTLYTFISKAALSIWKAVESYHHHNLSWVENRKAFWAVSFLSFYCYKGLLMQVWQCLNTLAKCVYKFPAVSQCHVSTYLIHTLLSCISGRPNSWHELIQLSSKIVWLHTLWRGGIEWVLHQFTGHAVHTVLLGAHMTIKACMYMYTAEYIYIVYLQFFYGNTCFITGYIWSFI